MKMGLLLSIITVAIIMASCGHAHADVPGMYGMMDVYRHYEDAERAKPRNYRRFVVKGSARYIARQRAPYIGGYVHNDPMTHVGCLTPKMRTVWALVVAHWGPLRIVSTCRPGAMIRGTHYRSLHASGNAIDFMPPPGRKREMVRWLHLHTLGGVMTYSNFSHIHIDVGPRFLALNARG